MPGQLPPGIGNDQQALQATAFVRQQPWYLQWMQSRGKTPDANGNVKLSDNERDELRDLVVAKGIGLNHKYDGIDENGQIVEEHHKLRNGLIAAAIGGAALTGFGAAGMGPLSGLFGAGTAAAEGTAAAAIPATEGIASATALGLPVTAIESAPWLTAAGTTAAGAGAAETAAGASPWLASTPVEAGTFTAPSSAASMAAGGSTMASNAPAGLFERLASKYGLDAAKGVIGGLFSNSANNKRLALENSMQDPYRGQLFQARDVAKLDQMATGDYTSKPTTITGRYAHTTTPDNPWLPSDTVRDVAAQNEASVASGAGGQYHLGDDTLPASNVRMPATSILRALMAARAKNQPAAPAPDPDTASPWLA